MKTIGILLVAVLAVLLTGCQSQTYNVDVAVNANGQSAAAPLSAGGCDVGKAVPNLNATTERSQAQTITVNLSLPASIAKPIEVSPARQIQPVVRDAALAVTGEGSAQADRTTGAKQ